MAIVMHKPDRTKEKPVRINENSKLNEDGGAAAGGLAFFASGWGAVSIGALAAGGLAGIVHALGNTIKGRFNKAANILTKLQKSFIEDEKGVDPNNVLPGTGFVSWISSLLTKALFGGRTKRKGLGLHPFVDAMKDEIDRDYENAKEAYKNIILYSDEDENLARNLSFSIINNFLAKYVNTDAVTKKLGIDPSNLADMDDETADRLKALLNMYSGKNDKVSAGMYARLNRNYDNMLKHYDTIGQAIINNFKKYTKINTDASNSNKEKNQNLLTASFEKLSEAWEKQMDFLRNNFMHIVTEIVSYEGYIKYFKFVSNDVISTLKNKKPDESHVEKTEDGDEIYTIEETDDKIELSYPEAGQRYVLRDYGARNTGTGKEDLDVSSYVEIVSCDKDAKTITYKMLGLCEDYLDRDKASVYDTKYFLDDSGEPIVVKDLPLTEWADHVPERNDTLFDDLHDDGDSFTMAYKRSNDDEENYIIGLTGAEEARSISKKSDEKGDKLFEEDPDDDGPKDDDIDNIKLIIFAKASKDNGLDDLEDVKALSTNVSKDEFEKMMVSTSDDGKSNMGFQKIDDEEEAKKVKDALVAKKDSATTSSLDNIEDLPSMINGGGDDEDDDDDEKDVSDDKSQFVKELADALVNTVHREPSYDWNFKKELNVSGDTYEITDEKYKLIKKCSIKKLKGNVFQVIVPEEVAGLTNDANERISINDFLFGDAADYTEVKKQLAAAQQNQQDQGKENNHDKEDNQDNQQPGNNAQGNATDTSSNAAPASSETPETEKEKNEALNEEGDENGNTGDGDNDNKQNTGSEEQPKQDASTQPSSDVSLQVVSPKCYVSVENYKVEVVNVKGEDDKEMPTYDTIVDAMTKAIDECLEKNDVGLAFGKSETDNNSFRVDYKPSSAMHESSASASFTRNISCRLRHPETYHIFSVCSWGDTGNDTVKSLRESMLTLFHKARGYRDFAKAARESHFIHLTPFNESMNVTVPSSRYNMFEAGNPLYEYVIVMKFGKDGSVDEIFNTGVHRIDR